MSRYVVYAVDLAGNSFDLCAATPDPVEALCSYYVARNQRKGQGYVGIYDEENPEDGDRQDALEEIATCTRWGAGADRCLKPWGHLGVCHDAQGNTTLTLAAEILNGSPA